MLQEPRNTHAAPTQHIHNAHAIPMQRPRDTRATPTQHPFGVQSGRSNGLSSTAITLYTYNNLIQIYFIYIGEKMVLKILIRK